MTATSAKNPIALNVKLILPFVNSVKSVFSTMVKVETEVERPYLKTSPAPSYDVSSIIGFSGNIVGSVVVSFQREAAERLATAFAGMPLKLADADFADAIGELANMIAGGAKTQLGRSPASPCRTSSSEPGTSSRGSPMCRAS